MLMTTNDKISDESLQKLHKAIQIYDKLKGKDYLIGYGTNSREKIEIFDKYLILNVSCLLIMHTF